MGFEMGFGIGMGFEIWDGMGWDGNKIGFYRMGFEWQI